LNLRGQTSNSHVTPTDPRSRTSLRIPRVSRFFNIERMDMILKGLGRIKKVLDEILMQQEHLFGDETKAA